MRDVSSPGAPAAASASGSAAKPPEPNVPRVSIGLAVYNGDRYLAQAIESIWRRRTATSSSSSSTTPRPMEPVHLPRFAARDPRIRYTRNPATSAGRTTTTSPSTAPAGSTSLGGPRRRPGSRRSWRSAWPPSMSTPTSPRFSQGHRDRRNRQGTRSDGSRRGHRAAAAMRLKTLFSRRHKCEAIYGLVRTTFAGQTGLLRNYRFRPRPALRLALRGRFLQLPRRSSTTLPRRQPVQGLARAGWPGSCPTAGARPGLVPPTWAQFFHYSASCLRAAACCGTRFLLGLDVHWLGWNGKRMAKDVAVAATSFRARLSSASAGTRIAMLGMMDRDDASDRQSGRPGKTLGMR